MSLATLGPITFEVTDQKVLTWVDAHRSGEARWATHEVFAGKPVKEFLGPGDEKLSMSVRLDSSLGVVPSEQIDRLREARDTGAVLQFVIGGALFGDWILKGVDEQWRIFDRNGEIAKAQVGLSLESYA
jgi:phage protein U